MGPAPHLDHANLHHRILRTLVDRGNAPSIDELAAHFERPRSVLVEALRALQEYHGVVLHPATSEVWVIHPFATAPTNFWVESARGSWWGNCAWCSLGVAALLDEDVTITTTLGGESEQVRLRIRDGQVIDDRYLVHFPIPMRAAWDNVVYTCSTMLLFESAPAVDDWCLRHRIPRGDVQPVSRVWDFARAWYGRHLDENWTKWSSEQAKEIFDRFQLTGPTWDLPVAATRF